MIRVKEATFQILLQVCEADIIGSESIVHCSVQQVEMAAVYI